MLLVQLLIENFFPDVPDSVTTRLNRESFLQEQAFKVNLYAVSI